MDARKIDELENLLSTVLPNVVIIRIGESERLSYEIYRQHLQRCRDVYDPRISPWLSSYRPDVNQREKSDELLGFVSRELADHIRDGKIHSATIAFSGGMSGGSAVEDVVVNLLRRTIVDGPKIAARAFADCTMNTSCSFFQFFPLSGVHVESPMKIFEGVTLIPMPETTSKLPPHLPLFLSLSDRNHNINYDDLLRKTLVRVEYEVSPIFCRPAESYTFDFGPEKHFEIKLKGAGAEDCNLDVLCQALALAGRCSVRSVMTWTSLLDYEIFDFSTIWGISASGYSAAHPLPNRDDPSIQLNRRQLEAINTLYRGLAQPSERYWEWLRIPIDRWMKSMLESDPIDQIIDLGIALESLYVPDSRGEVNFRFALHAAWHLGKSKAERGKLREEFREIYAARSDVMHTGQFRGRRAKTSFDTSQFIRRAQDLCWQGITSVIDTGEIPDWEALIVGDGDG